MKVFKKVLIFYFVLTVILFIVGLIPNSSSSLLELSEKYFSKEIIKLGYKVFLSYKAVSLVRIFIFLIFIYIVIRKKYEEKIFSYFKSKINNRFIVFIFCYGILFISISLINMPLSIVSGYILGKYFQFVSSDFLTWFGRYILSVILNGFLTMIVFSIFSMVIILIKNIKKYALLLPLIVLFLGLIYVIIYPNFILPMFYKITPLKDEVLKNKISIMAQNANVNINDISIINSGDYSTSINAMFIGFGSEKKIILYDTLFKKLNMDEAITVIAHEMGHYYENHVLIGLLLTSMGILLFTFLLNEFSKFTFKNDLYRLLKNGFFIRFFILIWLLLFFVSPLEKNISRYIEWRADSYALKYCKSPEVFINMKVKLAINNKSNILSNSIYEWFFYTHPSVLRRIKHAEVTIKP